MIARRRSMSRGKVSLVTGMERAAQIARSRLLFAAIVFAVGFVVMAARVIDVAIFTDGNEPRLARVPAATPLATGRADIIDRNGVLLATSLNAASLPIPPRSSTRRRRRGNWLACSPTSNRRASPPNWSSRNASCGSNGT